MARNAISSEKGEIDAQKPARYVCRDSTVRGVSFFMAVVITANLISENKFVVFKNFSCRYKLNCASSIGIGLSGNIIIKLRIACLPNASYIVILLLGLFAYTSKRSFHARIAGGVNTGSDSLRCSISTALT